MPQCLLQWLEKCLIMEPAAVYGIISPSHKKVKIATKKSKGGREAGDHSFSEWLLE